MPYGAIANIMTAIKAIGDDHLYCCLVLFNGAWGIVDGYKYDFAYSQLYPR